MTMAVRGIVEPRLVRREKELHREILALSILYDHRTVVTIRTPPSHDYATKRPVLKTAVLFGSCFSSSSFLSLESSYRQWKSSCVATTVRIYGHYPIIKGNDTAFYRHPIRTFDFTELDGEEKWTACKFTKNVYDIWMPTHLKRICSVIHLKRETRRSRKAVKCSEPSI
jgi:hypothetical protein